MSLTLPALLLAAADGLSQAQWLVIIACIVTITLLLLRSQRRRAVGASPKHYRREIDAATRQSATLKRDMEQLLVELSEFARQINTQVDTRFAKLERSIADADRRIAALRILIAEARGDGAGAAADPPPAAGLDLTVGDAGVVQRERPGHAVDPPRAPPGSAAERSAEPEPVASVAPTVTGGEDINRRIYALADQGRTALDIARELQQSVGEVELILNLRRRGGA